MIKREKVDYGLEYLLAFDGRVHIFENGCWVKFEIKRVETTKERPHGLYYSFTLHAPDGTRLLGFDNAHGVPAQGSKFKKRAVAHDHWHRTETDPGRPYKFKDAETLLTDFETEVDQIIAARGGSSQVVSTKEKNK
jgi:Family of unknown function (DUF6516)